MQYESFRVGNTIRCLREQRCWTLEEMSHRLDRSVSHVVQVELGKRRIGLDTLYKLMDVLNVDANTILLIAEPKCEPETSIDTELSKLPEEDRRYLSGVFQYMIDQICTDRREAGYEKSEKR